MIYYIIFQAVAAVAAGILLTVLSKKADGVVYGRLDKAGRITNIILLLAYLCATPLCVFLSSISTPAYGGLLGIIGGILSVTIASQALICGVGLGFSVLLRKRGKSKLSFAVQFAGVVGIGLTILLFALFSGNLLHFLN